MDTSTKLIDFTTLYNKSAQRTKLTYDDQSLCYLGLDVNVIPSSIICIFIPIIHLPSVMNIELKPQWGSYLGT